MQDLWHNLDYDARSKESFLVLILKDEYFSLSLLFSLSLSLSFDKRIEIGLFTVWLADNVNQWNHVPRYYLSKGRRNWTDAC